MSGGSYNYFCFDIGNFANAIENQHTDPRRASFAKLLLLIKKAAHDIEWVDSFDYGKGDEHQAIDEVFSFLTPNPEVLIKAHAYDEFKTIVKSFLETEEK